MPEGWKSPGEILPEILLKLSGNLKDQKNNESHENKKE